MLFFLLLFLLPFLGNAQTPLSCTAQASGTFSGRAEGHYEQVGDVIVQCNGAAEGASYSGLEIESSSVLVPFTSRTLDSANAITEALLLIDEPAPAAQVLCETPLNPASCPNANVFPGIRFSSTKIRFAFPSGGPRTLRITNLRVAFSQFGVAPGGSEEFQPAVRETSTGVPAPQRSLSLAPTGVRLATTQRSLLTSPPASPPAYGCADVNPELAQDASAFATADGRNFVVRLSESSFPSAFRRRSAAAPPLGGNPPAPEAQNTPGTIYQTETGFYNPAFPSPYADTGLPVSGSRLFLRIHNVPNGVKLFVPSQLVLKTRLLPSNTTADTGFAKRVITDPDGAGEFLGLQATSAIGGGIAQMAALGAYHQAIYEIVTSDTTSFEFIDVPVYPAYLASSGTSGAMTLTAGWAPLSTDVTGESAITPRFQNYSTTYAVAQFNGCQGFTITPQSDSVAASGGTGSIAVAAPPNTPWTATSNDAWITITAGGSSTQGNTISYSAGPNPLANARTGTITVGPVMFTINQLAGPATAVQLVPAQEAWGGGSSGISSFTVIASEPWTAVSNANWLVVISTSNGQVRYSVAVNPGPAARVGTITVNSATFTVTQSGNVPPLGRDMSYVPVTPCRMVDTRGSPGAFGQPALAAQTTRSFTPFDSPCAVPRNARAYALNVTVVPKGTLGFLSIWPTGYPQPLVSTLNSPDGRIKANAAIVPAGSSGAIDVMATDDTELIIDINGYFVESTQPLVFYPLPPCRVLDTRNGNGPLGGPVLANGSSRSFPVRSSNCGVPATAQAYSVNATVVPSGPLGYLTLWPTGQAQPFVSTLNSPRGAIVANAAIVPAGTDGAISAYVTDQTHLVLDINGYFAPPGSPGALRFNAVSPCRVLDTRNPNGTLGGPFLTSGQTRTWPVTQSPCELTNGAGAYSMNATVVPNGRLDYLTMWPAGQAQPFVSTLNAAGDPIVANALLVPAGTAGAVSSYVTNQTHLVLDVNGYFAP